MHTHKHTHRKLGLGIFFSFSEKKRERDSEVDFFSGGFRLREQDKSSFSEALSFLVVGGPGPSIPLSPPVHSFTIRSNWRDGAVRRRWRTGDVNCFPVSFSSPCCLLSLRTSLFVHAICDVKFFSRWRYFFSHRHLFQHSWSDWQRFLVTALLIKLLGRFTWRLPLIVGACHGPFALV